MDPKTDEINVPDILKGAGLRVTPQRDAILRHILTNRGHMSADEIYRAMQHILPNLSVSTVYNTLKCLSDVGLIREIKFGDAASLFDANTSPHHHMVCNKCGKLIDFYLPSTPNVTHIAEQEKFHIEEMHIAVRGICNDCAKSREPD
ncbi:Fur family transcriptional regulator [Alicyclobacillus pomorum]|jgi:Fur family transcriptional regulator, peroxide stress response regulator|uniref:Fur family transcriptional regulator n=1 Tax=Alicyclobacillus pomorum TaxID=204470 RepID=UPI00047C135D|nr:Fur family transcriptional regulator [Alicyclobacillus pomorum]